MSKSNRRAALNVELARIASSRAEPVEIVYVSFTSETSRHAVLEIHCSGTVRVLAAERTLELLLREVIRISG